MIPIDIVGRAKDARVSSIQFLETAAETTASGCHNSSHDVSVVADEISLLIPLQYR